MQVLNNTFVKVNESLALSVANCRNENKVYVINGVTFQWKRNLFSFLVDGMQKSAANVYADLGCNFSKLGKVSFVEYIK